MTVSILFVIMILLAIKHLVADFLFQPPWMYKNKGTYGHLGGITHAGFHMLLSALIFYGVHLWLFIVVMEFILHYHIDWAKMRLNSWLELTPTNSENFWRLLGVDQFFHSLTYIWMLWMLT